MSLRVHASSALVPNAAVISPVVRIHLVDPELGSPVRPSGEATTPIQTAPFDLTRRRAATFAAEWEEALEVEEALGDVLTARAVALFEVLQLPPSFTYYEERSASFPDGRPMRVAWGFRSCCAARTGSPTWGVSRCSCTGGTTARQALGPAAPPPIAAAPTRPRCSRVVARAPQVVPSMRRLYPAHLDVTVAASPRSDVVAALLSAPGRGRARRRRRRRAPAAPKSLSGAEPTTMTRPVRRAASVSTASARWAAAGATPRRAWRARPSPSGRRWWRSWGVSRTSRCATAWNSKAAAAARDAQIPAEAEAATPGLSGSTAWKGMAAKRSVVKLPHARAKQEECLIPNADARTQTAPPRGGERRDARVVRPHGQTARRREPRSGHVRRARL